MTSVEEAHEWLAEVGAEVRFWTPSVEVIDGRGFGFSGVEAGGPTSTRITVTKGGAEVSLEGKDFLDVVTRARAAWDVLTGNPDKPD